MRQPASWFGGTLYCMSILPLTLLAALLAVFCLDTSAFSCAVNLGFVLAVSPANDSTITYSPSFPQPPSSRAFTFTLLALLNCVKKDFKKSLVGGPQHILLKLSTASYCGNAPLFFGAAADTVSNKALIKKRYCFMYLQLKSSDMVTVTKVSLTVKCQIKYFHTITEVGGWVTGGPETQVFTYPRVRADTG